MYFFQRKNYNKSVKAIQNMLLQNSKRDLFERESEPEKSAVHLRTDR